MNKLSKLDKLRASTNVVSDKEYKEAFQNVSHVAAEILARTLGPYAHTTIIDDGNYRYSTKDGWSIANRILFNDALANSLFSFIKSISFNLVSKVGDGTTTAIVAADKFITAMESRTDLKEIRQKDLLDYLQRASSEIVSTLKKEGYVHKIDPQGDLEDIYRIAFTSTNGNEEISRMIQRIYQETHNPNIYVNLGNNTETTMEIQTGYRFECNPIMLKNYTNTDTKEFRTDVGNAKAMFFNHNVTYVVHRRLIEELLAMYRDAPGFRGTTIILLAPYFDDTISGAINQANNSYISRGLNPPIMMIQVPMMNTVQKHFYNDFRSIIGNLFVESQTVEAFNRLRDPDKFTDDSTDAFMKNFANLSNYHSCREVITDYLKPLDHCTIGRDFILVEEYDTTTKEYRDVYQNAKEEYEYQLGESSKRMTDLDKEFMDASMRFTRISGKMGIINVGGASELERKCLKDSVDDAVLASRSAYENGYVAGMNLATIGSILKCINRTDDSIMKKIYGMLEDAFEATDVEILRNAYPNKTEDELRQSASNIIEVFAEKRCGCNLVTKEFEPEDQLTVINSVNTDIEIVKGVISILGYALTSNQMVSLTRSVDREVMTGVKDEAECERYYRIGRSIAEAMKDSGVIPTIGYAETASDSTDPSNIVPLNCKQDYTGTAPDDSGYITTSFRDYPIDMFGDPMDPDSYT